MPHSSFLRGAAILCILLAVALIGISDAQAAFCAPFTNCGNDGHCGGLPDGNAFCRNRVCMCFEPDPGICPANRRCDSFGLHFGIPPGGSTVHITSCRGANSGGIGGVISYCFAPACVPYQGSPCQSAPNSCGMRNSGTYRCDGSCNASRPPDSACGTVATGSFTSATCTLASGTATDADGSPVTVRIYEGASQIASGPAAPAFAIPLSFAPITNGIAVTHTLRAYAVDIPTGTQVQLLADQNAVCLPPLPTVSISAAPPTVAFDGTTTISWTTSGALSCTASDGSAGWAGPQPVNGSFPTGPLQTDTTFTLQCTNDGGPTTTQVTVTVGPPPPPTALITAVVPPDYCSGGPAGTVQWDYTSTAGLPMSHWQLQAATDALFSTVVYDSGSQTAGAPDAPRFSLRSLLARVVRAFASVVRAAPLTESHEAAIPQGILQYDTTYYVRVQVWDGATVPPALTGWSPSDDFVTPESAYPVASASVNPLPPFVGTPTTFTDDTDYGAGSPVWREWDFGDGTVLTESPAGASPVTHTYTGVATGLTATMRIRSVVMQPTESCEVTVPFSVSPAIPDYKEVLPGLR